MLPRPLLAGAVSGIGYGAFMVFWKAVDREPVTGSWLRDFALYAGVFGAAMTVYFWLDARRRGRKKQGPDLFD